MDLLEIQYHTPQYTVEELFNIKQQEQANLPYVYYKLGDTFSSETVSLGQKNTRKNVVELPNYTKKGYVSYINFPLTSYKYRSNKTFA